MGFWNKAFDITKNIGTVAYSTLADAANTIKNKKEELEQKDDRELLRLYKSNGAYGGIARQILKERGVIES